VSPVFKAAFGGNFKEGKEQTMELLDDNVEAFEHVVSHIYRGVFGRSSPTSSAPERQLWFNKLSTAIYVLELSERLQILGMKIKNLAEISMSLNYGQAVEVTVKDIELAFNLLPEDSQAIEEIVSYVAKDFLSSGLQCKSGFQGWKFEPAMRNIEGLETHLLFAIKKLALRGSEHSYGYTPGHL
jgi:hypothetical protein